MHTAAPDERYCWPLQQVRYFRFKGEPPRAAARAISRRPRVIASDPFRKPGRRWAERAGTRWRGGCAMNSVPYRIGPLVPSSHTTMETEITAMLHRREQHHPERFTFPSSRMRRNRDHTKERAENKTGW